MSRIESSIKDMGLSELFETQQQVETQLVRRGVIPGPGLTYKRAYKKISSTNQMIDDCQLFASLASKIVLNADQFEDMTAIYKRAGVVSCWPRGKKVSYTGLVIQLTENKTFDDYIKDIRQKMNSAD